MTTKENKQQEVQEIPPQTTVELETPLPGKSLGLILTFIVAILALLASLYSMGSNYLTQQENKKYQQQLSTLTQSQAHLEKAMEVMLSNLNQTVGTMEQKIQNSTPREDSSSENKAMDEQQWLLQKAQLYLELASVSNTSNQPSMTVGFLTHADKILADLKDQNLNPVRQAIAEQLKRAESLTNNDWAQALRQLDDLQHQIEKLTQPVAFMANSEANVNQTLEQSGWKTNWQNSLKLLGKLVIVKHHDGNYEPGLTPMQLDLAKNNIVLNLQEAQWALLNRNDAIFQQALIQAITSLQTTLTELGIDTTLLVKTLQELQSLKLANSPLDPGKPLNLIDAIIKKENSLPTKNTGAKL